MPRHHFSLLASLLISLPLPANNAWATNRSVPRMNWPETPLQAKKSPERQTVADYFLAMPAQYLKVVDSDRITINQRQQLLKQAQQGQTNTVYDINNGYLRLNRSSDSCGSYTLAIFKRSSGSPLVARTISCTMGDSLVILDPDRNWQNVTRSILPIKVEPSPETLSNMMIVLPRFGKTIEFYQEENPQQLIGRYRFNGNKFVKI